VFPAGVYPQLPDGLQDAGVKLSSVTSDLLGKSSRAMLDALVAWRWVNCARSSLPCARR
jgi:hypothetical protein